MTGIPCMQMRGGSSKGAYFLRDDLPADPAERDDLLLRIMGSPDERQVDGLGGGHPLTSKVAVVCASGDPDADVDYLFLQVVPGRPVVTDAQTCGNLLAGVGPFAIERGLVPVAGDTTTVRIRIVNPTVSLVEATVRTPGGRVRYDGDTVMAGTPFPAAPIDLAFPGGAGPVFPTGRVVDSFAGLEVTCVDAGMPVVLLRAADLGLAGDEDPAVLEGDAALRERVESVRLEAGAAMGLGDVRDATVPKMSIVSAPRHGGTVTTRTFIPHRVHAAIGVLGAVSVAVAVRTPGTVAHGPDDTPVRVEHPTGTFDVAVDLDPDGAATRVRRTTVVRTARKLSDGLVWPRPASIGKATG
ncbi:4-oxalomesaconate tautomerase [Dactylosporangium sp. AC04546]|uniref:4-oxalomesaconate tautomerase n=1 Tax=Dactylosporangium sp. AC04546 TaxID=2862460 RepID=UPI001EE03834|nr:4-oxalomesaconate tautomerase [Dactylosporangium sp. AC04546]WVK78748.1 4-oxalomesaconate tautomerase [Dactylosporangium sp. AC04546]